jgi:hypothetical protein
VSFKPKERRRDFARDSKERKKERLDAAFDLARKIQADEIEKLRQAGLKGEKLKKRVPNLNEIADSLLVNHSDAIDRLLEERKRQLEEVSRRTKRRLSEFYGKRLERIADGFKRHLEEKKQRIAQGESERASDGNTGQDTRASSLKAVLEKARETRGEREPDDSKSIPRPERRKLDGLKKEIHRLYYEKGLTQLEIAKRFGVAETTMGRLFKRQGWLSRVDRRGVRMRVFENDEERKEARKEHRRVTQRKIRELRKSIFGTKCEICDIDTKEEKRTLAIHRKDGTEHDQNALWRMKFLNNLNREDWTPLCIPCHRGTHWLMKWANKDWDYVKSQKELSARLSKETLEPLTREDYKEPRTSEVRAHLGESAKEVRKSLFGESCHFCGEIEDGKRMAIHRKDGRPHDIRILSSAKYLKIIDPDEWVPLCSKCHRQVTWAGNILGMNWETSVLMTR